MAVFQKKWLMGREAGFAFGCRNGIDLTRTNHDGVLVTCLITTVYRVYPEAEW
jgi:hypothetical protein